MVACPSRLGTQTCPGRSLSLHIRASWLMFDKGRTAFIQEDPSSRSPARHYPVLAGREEGSRTHGVVRDVGPGLMKAWRILCTKADTNTRVTCESRQPVRRLWVTVWRTALSASLRGSTRSSWSGRTDTRGPTTRVGVPHPIAHVADGGSSSADVGVHLLALRRRPRCVPSDLLRGNARRRRRRG
jgi:hypothetical protein